MALRLPAARRARPAHGRRRRLRVAAADGESGPVLRGERPLELRRDPTRTTKPKKRREGPGGRDRPEHPPVGRRCATATRLADEQGVPPYVIFHDATLAAMIERRPANRGEFAGLHGVGEDKAGALRRGVPGRDPRAFRRRKPLTGPLRGAPASGAQGRPVSADTWTGNRLVSTGGVICRSRTRRNRAPRS